MADTPLLAGIASTALSPVERERFARLRPAGYLLLERNLESPEQTRRLTDSLREIDPGLEPVIAIAAQGGASGRLDAVLPRTPSAAALGAEGKVPKIADSAAFTADLLRLLGINLNLAPVLDLDHPPDGPESDRRWHRDPQRVIDHAGMWNRWLRKHKVRTAAGYFPAGGRGRTSSATLGELLAADLIPYTALMPELDALIIGHQDLPAIDPDFPASLSKRIITRLLRDQLGFDRHLVLTDDLGDPAVTTRFPAGDAVPAAFRAGVDLVVVARDSAACEITAARLREVPDFLLQDADRRIERFRKQLHDPLPWSAERWDRTCQLLPSATA